MTASIGLLRKVWLVLSLFTFSVCGNLFGADTISVPQAWIVTNVTGEYKPPSNYLDLTPSVKTNVPNSNAYYNIGARLFICKRDDNKRACVRHLWRQNYGKLRGARMGYHELCDIESR
jgi:hypothetical protein